MSLYDVFAHFDNYCKQAIDIFLAVNVVVERHYSSLF